MSRDSVMTSLDSVMTSRDSAMTSRNLSKYSGRSGTITTVTLNTPLELCTFLSNSPLFRSSLKEVM